MNKSFQLGLALIALLMAVLATDAEAGTIKVPSDHNTIQTAIAAEGIDAGGVGCSITQEGYHISKGSAFANILILFLPLILIGIRWLRKLEAIKKKQGKDWKI